MSESFNGFAPVFIAELLCSAPPAVSKRVMLDELRRRWSGAAPLDEKENEGLLAFVHPRHSVQYKGGPPIPAQIFMSEAGDEPPEIDFLTESIQQSHWMPNAGEIVARCKREFVVTDFMASGLEYHKRLEVFQQALAAAVTVIPCDAIHLHPSRQLIPPSHLLDQLKRAPAPNLAAGAINIRIFRITNGQPGDTIMDSLGLAALGLPDVQCHFRGLDPDAVARQLYNIAAYIFDAGDVVEDGHTIEGTPPGNKWRCQHERSLVGPEREVLDVDPGPEHAAGKRKAR